MVRNWRKRLGLIPTHSLKVRCRWKGLIWRCSAMSSSSGCERNCFSIYWIAFSITGYSLFIISRFTVCYEQVSLFINIITTRFLRKLSFLYVSIMHSCYNSHSREQDRSSNLKYYIIQFPAFPPASGTAQGWRYHYFSKIILRLWLNPFDVDNL